MITPAETALPWRDIGDANTDLTFPETDDSNCPVNKNARKLSTDEAAEYMRWIQQRTPTLDVKDKRVYCAYCDMKNHPRWSCHHYYKHQKSSEKHSCTLCIGGHTAFLCPLAMVNGGIATPNWAQREKKMAKDDKRTPDLTWYPKELTTSTACSSTSSSTSRSTST